MMVEHRLARNPEPIEPTSSVLPDTEIVFDSESRERTRNEATKAVDIALRAEFVPKIRAARERFYNQNPAFRISDESNASLEEFTATDAALREFFAPRISRLREDFYRKNPAYVLSSTH